MFIIENKNKEELGRYETIREAKRAYKNKRFNKVNTDWYDVYTKDGCSGRIKAIG